MKILLTNDDGLLAPGLAAIYNVLDDFGQVQAVAPEDCQSGSGHSLTIGQSMSCRQVAIDDSLSGWAVGGRPADCVKLAIRELGDGPLDLVVSGLNNGANVGINVFYSGTVAAAVEAAFFGIPGVAFSLETEGRENGAELAEDMAKAARVSGRILRQIIDAGLPKGAVLNVNIPAGAVPKGVRFVRQSTVGIDDSYMRQEGEQGELAFSMSREFSFSKRIDDTDVAAVAEGYVSVTPLHFDLTNYEQLHILSDNQWRVTGD